MPRRARYQSESGIYHVILRGCDRQTIFWDDEYSSMKAYCGKEDGITDVAFAKIIAAETDLLQFLQGENDDHCLEMNDAPRKGMIDRQASICVRKSLGDCSDYKKEDRVILAKKIRILHNNGVSIRQINRLSGIPKGVIERCLHKY